MCGRYVLKTPAKLIQKLFLDVEAEPDPRLVARYNIAPTQEVPVVRVERTPDGEEGRRALAFLRWGLVPFWAKDVKIASRMINARIDTIETKNAFKDALKRRRCLVPADGFIEWRTEGKKKLPHYIHPEDGGLLAFAGLYERNKTLGTETFTILTTDANAKISTLHDRMPVIVPPEKWDAWLDPASPYAALDELKIPFTARPLAIQEVSTTVNSVKNDDPSCLEPVIHRPEGAA